MTTDNKQSVLTDEQINLLLADDVQGDVEFHEFARAIEQAILSKLRSAGEPVSPPPGWKFRVHFDDDRAWLELRTPHGACAAMSTRRKEGNGGETITSQVLGYLGDALAAPQASAEQTATLEWIMRQADNAKEPCGDDPESLAAIRNAKLSAISQAAAQALGMVRGPSYAAVKVSEARPTDGDLWDQTLAERDDYHDWSDELSQAIAAHLGIDIGEHSSGNLPWLRALDAIKNAASSASAEVDRAALMHAIVESGQSAGIIRSDLESVSVAQCLHILECLSKPAPAAEDSAKVAEDVALPKLPKPQNGRIHYARKDIIDYARAAVLADRQQRAGDVKPWIDLFWGVAKELNCLPSLFVDDNEHVLRAAREARAALSAQEGKQ